MTMEEWRERQAYLTQTIVDMDLMTNYHVFSTDFSGFLGHQEDPSFDQKFVEELKKRVAAVKPPVD